MHGIGIKEAGIEGIGEIADAIQQVRRLTEDEHDGPGGTEAHDLIGGEKGTAVQMLPSAAGSGVRLEDTAARRGGCLGDVADGLLAESVGQIPGGVKIGGAEELLRGVGQEALPAGIDRLELGEVLDEQLAHPIHGMAGIRRRVSRKLLIAFTDRVSRPTSTHNRAAPHPPCPMIRPHPSSFQPSAARSSPLPSMAAA